MAATSNGGIGLTVTLFLQYPVCERGRYVTHRLTAASSHHVGTSDQLAVDQLQEHNCSLFEESIERHYTLSGIFNNVFSRLTFSANAVN